MNNDQLITTALMNLARAHEFKDKWYYGQILDVLGGKARADVTKTVRRHALEHMLEQPRAVNYQDRIKILLTEGGC